MGLDTNSEHDTPWLRYGYTSMTTPETTYELSVETGERRQLKQQPVLGYDASKYATERTCATARRGTKPPGSLVSREGCVKTANAPLIKASSAIHRHSTAHP